MKTTSLVRLIIVWLVAIVSNPCRGTGYFGPSFYLDEGARKVAASPEFFWELEVKRLARDFHPSEKRVAPDFSQAQADERPQQIRDRFVALADQHDFETALQQGEINPSDATVAKRDHQIAREIIDSTRGQTTQVLPAEFASEFADYHRGAFAYRRGAEHWEEARQAWEMLLRRPEHERHYRSVWAAFMLGKMALKKNEPAAVTWFQRIRELARQGFADSLGMAADSYGWEGRSEWKQNHPEKAAPLFLMQLALGDETAIVSLKALVPDRATIHGVLNYGPEPDENEDWNLQRNIQPSEQVLGDLERAARDPLLRRLTTAHVLATTSAENFYRWNVHDAPANRGRRWLEVVDKLGLEQIEDAEYLGWAAYNCGDYSGAARWLKLARKDSAASCWLRAKLERRAGKLTQAAKSMAQAWKIITAANEYTGWIGKTSETEREYLSESPHWSFSQSASGDLGALFLERNDFVQALETLLVGNLWNDAAFVAERIVTTTELKSFIDQHPSNAHDLMPKLKYLLGRRLVRERQYDQAAAYMPPPYDQVLKRYSTMLRTGQDKKTSKNERARALFGAAWLARYDGMELMGTEGAPDGFGEDGMYEYPDLAKQLRSGTYLATDYSDTGGARPEKRPVALKLPQRAQGRLRQPDIVPDLRFHYRIIAAVLAIEAAELLPNDTEELADVVNRAGLWVKDRDEKLGDRYYQILERRCANTAIGRLAISRHWFVNENGPWSQAQQQAHDAMRIELHMPRDPQFLD